MQSIEKYQEFINIELLKRVQSSEFQEPKGLYEPCAYILKNGGKRVRASLVLLASKMFSNSFDKAIPVALAFETFHNFTLIHDDIMDNASIRRGQDTIHVKWNENTAILSGDAVMIMAYTFFQEAFEFTNSLLPLLNKTALQVCEGQQYDIDLEHAHLQDSIVNETMYVEMIKLKTSVLIAACLKAGALIGGASQKNADLLYDFGINLGIAFQLQDDLLDSYGDEQTFGKKIGGDIEVNKKTYLVIKALELLPEHDKKQLEDLFVSKNNSNKYSQVISLFNKVNIKEITEQKVHDFFANAQKCLDSLDIVDDNKKELIEFMKDLQKRAF